MTTKSIRKDPVLEALFTSQARVEVLKLLFLRSSGRHYLREIASLTGQPVRAIQRELARLESSELVTSKVEGNRKYFTANREAPVFQELRSLLVKTAGLGEAFSRTLRERSNAIELALIFGSYARGGDTPDSDIDLLVVGDLSLRELAALLAPLKHELQREVNPITIQAAEFRRRVKESDPFIQSVLAGEKIFLIGGEDELTGLAG